MNKTDFQLLYQYGDIAQWYLRDSQYLFYDMLHRFKKVVAKCHRRFGKGTTVFVYAFERAAVEKIIIRYGAPTQKQAYEILTILIEHIYDDCPQARPTMINGNFVWPSGSVLYVFGMKDAGEADKARGTEADIIIADEYAFWKYRPAYTLKSVLSPQLDTTDGVLFITSTPPVDLTHPYIEEVAEAEAKGYLFNWTIEDSLRSGDVDNKQHLKIIERCGGKDTDTYKREYLCSMIPDKAVLVIPEAHDEDMWIGSQERPDYFDMYSCFDLGFIDYFAGVWGYLDFLKNRLVIEAELFQHYKSTGENVESCREVDLALEVKDIKRFGDCADVQQLYDMKTDHDYPITPIMKRSKMPGKAFRDSVLNQLRLGISQGKILVNKERCPNTYMQLKFGFWNERRTDYERTEKMGHLDCLMALAYLYDNVDWQKNPFAGKKMADRIISHENYYVPKDMDPASYKRRNLAKLIGKK